MVLECGVLNLLETLRAYPGFALPLHLQCEDNLLSFRLCASHFPTLSSEACDITTLPSINNKSNLLWSSKILNMYVLVSKEGSLQLLQRRGLV